MTTQKIVFENLIPNWIEFKEYGGLMYIAIQDGDDRARVIANRFDIQRISKLLNAFLEKSEMEVQR